MGRVRRAGGIGIIEEEELPAEEREEPLALRVKEGPEGPESGTEDRPEERVLSGALGDALTRTKEDVAMERRERAAVVVARVSDVAALDVWPKLCREGEGNEG